MIKRILMVIGGVFFGLFSIFYGTANSWNTDDILYKGVTDITTEQYNYLNNIKTDSSIITALTKWNNGDIKEGTITFTYEFVAKADLPYLQTVEPNLWYMARHSANDSPLLSVGIMLIATLTVMLFISKSDTTSKQNSN